MAAKAERSMAIFLAVEEHLAGPVERLRITVGGRERQQQPSSRRRHALLATIELSRTSTTSRFKVSTKPRPDSIPRSPPGGTTSRCSNERRTRSPAPPISPFDSTPFPRSSRPPNLLRRSTTIRTESPNQSPRRSRVPLTPAKPSSAKRTTNRYRRAARAIHCPDNSARSIRTTCSRSTAS
jgi:hypothetical protein